MVENTCKTCKHFLQHYILHQGQLSRVYCGHCTHLSAKRKRPDCAACEHYLPGTSGESDFATKQYLTKALLQHILDLELLPKITEDDQVIP